MSATRTPARDFFSVQTVHMAIVSFWWTDERLHDTDYKIKVNDALKTKMGEMLLRYDVTNDTTHRCQWEGFCLVGSNLEHVNSAAKELCQHLAKFSGVVPLPERFR